MTVNNCIPIMYKNRGNLRENFVQFDLDYLENNYMFWKWSGLTLIKHTFLQVATLNKHITCRTLIQTNLVPILLIRLPIFQL